MPYYEAYVVGTDSGDGGSWGVPLHVPGRLETVLINPKVSLDITRASAFDFVLPPHHVAYDSIVPMGSTIEVREDGNRIFFGRPLPPERDLSGRKKYHCEGALAFLNDLRVPQTAPFNGQTMTDKECYLAVMQWYADHIEQGQASTYGTRRINLGTLPPDGTAAVRDFSRYPSPLEVIRDELLPSTGGWLVERPVPEETGCTVDYVAGFDLTRVTNTQPIAIRANILDLLQTGREFYTGAIAKGSGVGMDVPVVMEPAVMQKYGLICHYEECKDCTTLEQLEARCRDFLQRQQFNAVSLELKSVDLHLLNPGLDRIKLCDVMRLDAPETGLGDGLLLPVTGLEIPLDSGKKSARLGTPGNMTTLTKRQWQIQTGRA